MQSSFGHIVRNVLLTLPFLVVAWVHWLSSIQQQRDKPRLSLEQRDSNRARAALARRRKYLDGSKKRGMEVPSMSDGNWDQQVPEVPSVSNSHEAVAKGVDDAPTTASTCPASRKPYHTLLTATAQVYQQWQCRIMYYQWKKQRARDPAGACTEMTGFTRLVAHSDGQPDGLQDEIPSYFVREYTQRDYARFHGYRVINRPYSVVQFLETEYYRTRVPEAYIFIAETDHILVQPLPNRASLGSPMAYIFNYMGPNPAHANIIKNAWPAGGSMGYRSVQSIGPSPVVIHRKDLEKVAKPWEETAVWLKTNPEADQRLGWVIEMWGYSIAAAKIGLKHQEFADFQVEPGALSNAPQLRGFPQRYWIFHYTYQFEYMLDGTPCQPWTIGEFSLDKRHFSDVYPVPPLPEPPAKANVAAFYLLHTFNEAMANISSWPNRQPATGRPVQTLYGRRRLDWFSRHANGFGTELRTMPLVKGLAGSRWDCSGANGDGPLQLSNTGDASGLRYTRSGRWGSMNDPTLGAACPVYACIFMDMGGGWGRVGQFDVRYEEGSPERLVVMRHQDLKQEWTCRRQ